MSSHAAAPAGRSDESRLDSWKAIAVYLNRDVRTAQRWEEREGLPVHRLQHDRLASVYAFTSEIDAWISRRSVPPAAADGFTGPGGSPSSEVASPATVERLERRDVAVLVVRLTRPGQLADERPPDSLQRDLLALNEKLVAIAHQLGAHLQSRMGEHAVLVFGLHQAEEDDAVRAARGALAVREAGAHLGLPVAAGLAFGPLLATVGPGSGLHAGAVLDEARFLASRAGDGAILVGPTVWRIVSPFFAATSSEPFVSGGESIAVRRIETELQIQSRFDAAVRRGLTTFVGRRREIERLCEAVASTREGGGRLLHVVGDAGVGKSRLILEFRRAIAHEPLLFAAGRCPAHRRATSYWPFIEAISDVLSLRPQESVAAETVASAMLHVDPALEPFVPQVLHLLGIASPQHELPSYLQGYELKVALREAIAAVFLSLAHRQPVVLALEDWHWADEGSADVLQQMAHVAASASLLVVATSRPDAAPTLSWPPGIDTIAVEPLSAAETGTLVESLIGGGGLSAAGVQRVHERTGGNPFFVEELCDSIRDEGRDPAELENLQIPSTVQAVIRTRIDRLEPGDREVLRTAAVIGRECTRELLAQLLPWHDALEDSLRRLTGARMLHALRLGRDASFRFKHNLTQEVAYLSVPAFERKALHKRLAELLSDAPEQLLEQRADQLAFHFGRAEEWEPAARFGLRAAHRAFALTQFTQTVELLEQARRACALLPAVDRKPRMLADILLLEERASELLGDRTQQEKLLILAIDALESTTHRDLLAAAFMRLGELRTIQARFDDGRGLLAQALRICQTEGDRRSERQVWRALAFADWRNGRPEAALTSRERALAIGREIDDPTGVVTDLAAIAAVLRGQGHCQEALARLAEAEGVAGPNPVGASYLCQVTSSVHATMGDAERAGQALEQAIAIETTNGIPIQRVFSVLSLARHRLDMGRSTEGKQLYEECVATCRQLHYAHGLSMALPGLADAWLRESRWPEAAACLEEALTLLDRLHETEGAVDLHERLAWVRVQMREWAAARAAAERAAECALRLRDEARALETLERVAVGLTDHGAPIADVRAAFERALQAASSMSHALARGRLLNRLGITEFRASNYERARWVFEQALAVFEHERLSEGVVLMFNSLGATLRALGRRHEAIRIIETALSALDGHDEPRLRGHAMALLGDLYRDLEDPENALLWYERAASLRRDRGDDIGLAWMCQRLANLHLEAGLTDKAKALLADAQRLCHGPVPEPLAQAVAALAARLTPTESTRSSARRTRPS